MSGSGGETCDPRLAEWIESARNGSREGLGRIAETYRNYLLLVANHELDANLRPKVAASDIVQETLLAAGRKFDQFRGDSEQELLGWLRQILHNELADAARQFRQTEKRQLDRERPLVPLDDSKGADLPLAAPDDSPRADVIAREEQESLRRALEKLPDDYRQVIVLRNWDRLPFEEIGRRMGRTAAAASKLWSRAVERLGEHFESSDDD